MEMFTWWTDSQKKLAVAINRFVDDLMPQAEEAAWKQEFPWDIVESIAQRGYFGAGIAREYGGMGLSITGATIVAEELGRRGLNLPSSATLTPAQIDFICDTLISLA